MLIQSHLTDIHLLPALPDAWASGSIKGLIARGNFVIDVNWNNKEIQKVEIFSRSGEECSLLSSMPIKLDGVNVWSKPITINNQKYFRLKFKTEMGKKYMIVKK